MVERCLPALAPFMFLAVNELNGRMRVKVNDEKITYRRAGINDIDMLCSCRIEFLNSFFDHERDEETEELARVIKEYLLQAIPSNTFIAWIAEYDGKLIGMSGMVIRAGSF